MRMGKVYGSVKTGWSTTVVTVRESRNFGAKSDGHESRHRSRRKSRILIRKAHRIRGLGPVRGGHDGDGGVSGRRHGHGRHRVRQSRNRRTILKEVNVNLFEIWTRERTI
jgi:hypothetical protein